MQLRGFFLGGLWLALLCENREVRGLAALPGVARQAEGAGAMEQDPSPACTARASPGLLPDPALGLLCLLHFLPGAPGPVLSHQHSQMCVCAPLL